MQPIAYGTWYHVLRRIQLIKLCQLLIVIASCDRTMLTAIFLLGEEPSKQVFLGGTIIVIWNWYDIV